MALNIKFGEVNNLADARYAAALGATFLGFNLSPTHPQYVSPELLKEISGWAAGPILVTEWESEPAEVIADTCRRLGIDYVELNVFDPEITARLKPDFNVIQNITLYGDSSIGDVMHQLTKVNGLAMYYKFSFPSIEDQEMFFSKQGHKLMLIDCCRDYPVLLNFHFTPGNLESIIVDFNPFGINLRGSSEPKPGYKNFDDLNELVSLIENSN